MLTQNGRSLRSYYSLVTHLFFRSPHSPVTIFYLIRITLYNCFDQCFKHSMCIKTIHYINIQVKA